MPHFFVDDQFTHAEQVLAIPPRHRLAAIGLWTLAGSWSANQLTDGHVPDEVLKRLGARPQLIDCLVTCASLWERTDGGIQFTNWTKWQRTRDQVKAYRARELERKRRQRNQPPGDTTSSNGEVSHRDSDRFPPDCPAGSPAAPIPEPKPVTVTLGGGSPVGGVPASPPPQFCSSHPGGTEQPCAACGAARRGYTSWLAKQTRETKRAVAEAARELAAAKAQARSDCELCDGDGYRIDNPGVVCAHADYSQAAKTGRANVNEMMGWK